MAAGPPLFAWAQALQNSRRPDEHLALAEERLLPDEDELTRAIIDEIAKFTRENWLPGGAQRFGNTKTFGVLRGEFSVLPDLPAQPAARPVRGAARPTPHGCASPVRARTLRRTSRTSVSARSASR